MTTPTTPCPGWRFLALCVKLARIHPTWAADQLERRATGMLTMNCATEDEYAASLRQPARIPAAGQAGLSLTRPAAAAGAGPCLLSFPSLPSLPFVQLRAGLAAA